MQSKLVMLFPPFTFPAVVVEKTTLTFNALWLHWEVPRCVELFKYQEQARPATDERKGRPCEHPPYEGNPEVLFKVNLW